MCLDDPLIRRATVNGKKTKVDKVDDLVDVKVVASSMSFLFVVSRL